MAFLSPWCHSVCILPRGGPTCRESRLLGEGIEYMALKANILKIKRTEVRRFFAFAKILSTMNADQLGDFTESKMGRFSRVLSSEMRF